MDVLMVSPELAPWVSGAETGEMVAALSRAVRQLGHDVTVVTPRSPAYEEGGLLAARRLTPLVLPDGREATVFDAQLPSGVRLVLLEVAGAASDGAEHGSAARALEFCQAAAAFAKHRVAHGEGPDAVHVFDWETAAVPALLSAADSPPVVFSITRVDNETASGSPLPAATLESAGISSATVQASGGRLLGAGLLSAAACTVASVSYGETLKEAAGPAGELHAAFVGSADKLVGIAPGIDYARWNPATDAALPARFSAEEPEAKGIAKTALMRALEFDGGLERPLVSIVGELTKEAGTDVVLAALARLLKQGVNVVFAGKADAAVGEALELAAEKAPKLVAYLREPDDGTLRRVLGASDLVLVPARSAASPRTVQLAQRYGAVPVCHAVDTLHEAVVDCDASLGTGTGFTFPELSARDLLSSGARAVGAFGTPAWAELVRRIMRLDSGWDRPARRYVQLYRQVARATGQLAS